MNTPMKTTAELWAKILHKRKEHEAEDKARWEAEEQAAKAQRDEEELLAALMEWEQLEKEAAEKNAREKAEKKVREEAERKAREETERKEREKQEEEVRKKKKEELKKTKHAATTANTNADAGPSHPRVSVVVPTLAQVEARRKSKTTETSELGSSCPLKRPQVEVEESEEGEEYKGSGSTDEGEGEQAKVGMHRCTQCILYNLVCSSTKSRSED